MNSIYGRTDHAPTVRHQLGLWESILRKSKGYQYLHTRDFVSSFVCRESTYPTTGLTGGLSAISHALLTNVGSRKKSTVVSPQHGEGDVMMVSSFPSPAVYYMLVPM